MFSLVEHEKRFITSGPEVFVKCILICTSQMYKKANLILQVLYLFGLWFNVQVNSLGNVKTANKPKHFCLDYMYAVNQYSLHILLLVSENPSPPPPPPPPPPNAMHSIY